MGVKRIRSDYSSNGLYRVDRTDLQAELKVSISLSILDMNVNHSEWPSANSYNKMFMNYSLFGPCWEANISIHLVHIWSDYKLASYLINKLAKQTSTNTVNSIVSGHPR